MDMNKQNINTVEAQKAKEDKYKHCEFDMYGDCDGSGDDVELDPEAGEA